MIVSKSLKTTSAILAASVLALAMCSNAYSGDAAIFKAIEDGNSELALRLARNGQMEVLSKRGTTPLMEAALKGDQQLVKTLVENGADIMHCERKGFTVIQMLGSLCARSKENMERKRDELKAMGFPEELIAQMLASSAIPAEYVGKEKQHAEILAYLREVTGKRQSELFKAIESDNVARVGELARKCPLDELGSNGRTPLMTAALRGNIEMVRTLLDAGSRASVRDGDGFSAAASMEMMLRASAANEENGYNGLNEKQMAWYRKAVEETGEPSEKRLKDYRMIRDLIVTYGNASATRGSFRNSSLFKAVMEGDADKVRRLATRSNLEERNSDGFTPLMIAALGGNLDVVKALIASGARLDTRGRDDKTVIELLEDVKEKCKAELDRVRKTLHGQGMTDRQIEDAVAAGKRLPGYPSKTQLQKLRNLDPVLEYLRTLK